MPASVLASRCMNIQPMPPAEVAIDVKLVEALLREQHNDVASLPIVEAGEGWDNKLFRLGEDLVVRLPRRHAAATLIEHETRWLPVIAPKLPLPVPVPVRVGRPGCGFPWAWVVARWFPGAPAATVAGGLSASSAILLAQFLIALHRPAPTDAPVNAFRTSLPERSAVFVERLGRLGPSIENGRTMDVWRAALEAPEWPGPPVWIHGDLHPGNLVVNDGLLTAVIDFGDLTAGDPAVDLAVTWMLESTEAQAMFRDTLQQTGRRLDTAVWRRARGWALSLGVAYVANSLDNPRMASIGARTIAAVLS
jgi:aminoglycoside phosphotransferase (APT) family kinase protein